MIPNSLPVKLMPKWLKSPRQKVGIILTRDTHILERRAITSGRVKALLLGSDTIENQIRQVVSDLHLDNFQPFTICLEDNRPLIARAREEVKNRVPTYVWKTQPEYVECPECHRIYWKGTHWGAMTLRLEKLTQYIQKEKMEFQRRYVKLTPATNIATKRNCGRKKRSHRQRQRRLFTG